MYSSPTFWMLYFLAGAIIFILPTAIGMLRGVRNLHLVILLNALALVTAGATWIAAIGFACFGEQSSARLPRRYLRRVPPQPTPQPVPVPEQFRGTAVEPMARAVYGRSRQPF